VLQHPAPSRDTRSLAACRCPGKASLTPAEIITRRALNCQINQGMGNG
jgi:hypothetical protein